MLHVRAALLAMMAAALAAPALRADFVTVAYPSVTSTYVNSGVNGPVQAGYFWSVARGDSITETFNGTGLATVNQLDLNFTVTENVLNNGAFVNWDVIVNGTTVGTWTWSEADGTGPVSLSYSFADILGSGSYTLRMAVTNEVAVGEGSIALGIPGEATLYGDPTVQTPEPSSLALLAGGLVLLGGALRRRRARR